MANMYPFHIALPAYDLETARDFYRGVLGLEEKRSAFNWVDFDFFGHQMSVHLVKKRIGRHIGHIQSTKIDNDMVPARHFGVIMPKDDWEELRDRVRASDVQFVIEPKVRFAGREDEQGTFFLSDPSTNYLEFKYFAKAGERAWV